MEAVIAENEAKTGAAFLTWRLAKGIEKVTREQNEVLMVLKADGQVFSRAQ